MLKKAKANILIILIWFIISLIVISITALLVHFNVINPNNTILIFIIGLLLFIVLGFLSGNVNQTKGLINGITTAFIVLAISSLFFFLGYREEVSLDIIVKLVIFMLSSGLGGILGVNFRSLAK